MNVEKALRRTRMCSKSENFRKFVKKFSVYLKELRNKIGVTERKTVIISRFKGNACIIHQKSITLLPSTLINLKPKSDEVIEKKPANCWPDEQKEDHIVVMKA
jgi:hypothetical protein